jgi:hypothetical protein
MVLLLRSSSRQTNKKRLLMTRFINLHNRGGFQGKRFFNRPTRHGAALITAYLEYFRK